MPPDEDKGLLVSENCLCGGDGSGLGGETSRLLRPLTLVLGADLLLAELVVPLGESEILQELAVHAILAGVAMGLRLLDSITVVLPVLVVMRIILRLGHLFSLVLF